MKQAGLPPADPPNWQRTRAALIDLCFERGYADLELRDLLDRAEIDEAEFHVHFADLEDCFCAVYLEIGDDFLGRVERAVSEQLNWRDRIRAIAYVLVRFLGEDERITHLSSVDVRTAGERARLLFGEATERLFDVIDEGRRERVGPTSISRVTAELVGGGILGQIISAVERKEPISEDMVPEMMYWALLPYLGKAAALGELTIGPPPSLRPT